MASYIDPYTKIDYSDPNAQADEGSIAAAIKNATPEGKAALLQNLRGRLDSGQLQTADFLKLAQPLAQAVSQDSLTLGGQGSGNASRGSAILKTLQDSGFDQKAAGHADVVPSLPQKYETDTRQQLVPTNLDPNVRNNIVNNIPNDISISSDRGKVEEEAAREQGQSQTSLDAQTAYRKQGLNDLAGILATNQKNLLDQSVPDLAEQANNQGIFRSTGYGNILANKASQLTSATQNQLALQGIQNQNLTAAGMGDINDNKLAMQQAGLQRQFTLDDFSKNVDAAKGIAIASQPQPQGKSGGQKALSAIQGAGSVAQIVGAGKGG